MCLAVTFSCPSIFQSFGNCAAGETVRYYTGAASSTALQGSIGGFGVTVFNISTCSTAGCNSPFTDSCSPAVAPAYGSRTCGVAPGVAPTAVAPAAADLTCFLTAKGATALSTAGGARVCGSATVSCAAVRATSASALAALGFSDLLKWPCSGANSNGIARVYFNSSTVASTTVAEYLPASSLFSEISLCNTAACNAPTTDACIPAPVPTTAAVAFTGLPSSTFSSTTGLSDATRNMLMAAISTAVALGCPACKASLTAMSSSATSSTVASTVTFNVTGSTTAAMAAATSSSIFAAAVTRYVASQTGFAGVTATAVSPPVAPPSAASLPTCKGVALAAAAATADLECYNGLVVAGGASPLAAVMYSTTAMASGMRVCAMYTFACPASLKAQGRCATGDMVRYYTGLPSLDQVSGTLTGFNIQTAYNVSSCTTTGCNSPWTDACALGAVPTYGSRACGVAPSVAPAVVAPAAADISCWNTINGVTTLSSAAGARVCGAATVSCAAANAAGSTVLAAIGLSFLLTDPTSPCYGAANAKAVARQYYNNTVMPPYLAASFPLYDIALCNTAACNAPTTDTCALAAAPVVAAVSFAGLPASSIANGALTSAALTTLQMSISTAVATSCPGCTANVTSVVDAVTAQVYYPPGGRRAAAAGAARALAGLGVVVVFTTTGGSTAAMTAATSGTAFAAPAPPYISPQPGDVGGPPFFSAPRDIYT